MSKSSMSIPLNFDILGKFGERYSGEELEYGAPICWDGKNPAILGKVKRGNADRQSITMVEEDYLECFDKNMIPIGMTHTHPKAKTITNYTDYPDTIEDIKKTGKTNLSLGDFALAGQNMKLHTLNPLLQQINLYCLNTPKNSLCVSPKPNSEEDIKKALTFFEENDAKITKKWQDFTQRAQKLGKEGINTLPKPFDKWTKAQLRENTDQFNEEAFIWINAYQMSFIKDEHKLSDQLYHHNFYTVSAPNTDVVNLAIDPSRFENILKGFEQRLNFAKDMREAYNMEEYVPPTMLKAMRKQMSKKEANVIGQNADQRLRAIQHVRKNALI